MKLGILGGTFDPIHAGHLALARAAMLQLKLDKIIFIPAYISPHKISSGTAAAGEDRIKMVELAVKNFPEFEVSSMELARRGVSYTVDTLHALKKQYPQDELYLILGSDTAQNFSRWKEPSTIQRLAVVAAAARPGYSSSNLMPEIQKISMEPCPFSASEIRRRISQGEKIEPGILPKQVEEYMTQKHLYTVAPDGTLS